MGFERWVDYALDVPMYFVKHDDDYVDVAGQSFRDLMAGKLPGMPGVRATISDWANHISSIFPEVRLKRYLEMRGSDSGPLPNLLALPALWVGILYDDVSLDAAWDLVKEWTARGASEIARRRAETRSCRDGARPHCVRNRDRRSQACARRARAPSAVRSRRPGRNALSRCAGGSSGARHHGGAGAVGEVPRASGAGRSIRFIPTRHIEGLH